MKFEREKWYWPFLLFFGGSKNDPFVGHQCLFRCNFNCSSPLCKCAIENEDNEHFLIRCNLYRRPRFELLNSISKITNDVDILFYPPSDLVNLLLYGDSKLDDEKNAAILRSTIKFIKCTSRFKTLEAYPDIS